MLNSQIDKQYQLGEVFNKYPVREIYAVAPFDFGQTTTLFVCLSERKFDWYHLYKDVVKYYKDGCYVIQTSDAHDERLKGTQLIWKDGTWYV